LNGSFSIPPPKFPAAGDLKIRGLKNRYIEDHLLRCGTSAYEIFINYYNDLKGENFLALPP